MNKLLSTPQALPFLVAVFINAFVDLGHKIVIQNTVFKVYDGAEQVILTAIINGLILLPFIMLFKPAGDVSDSVPKHRVMRLSAWAAVVLTVGITLCYAMGWFWVAFGMTFLLAVQSAFYGPAKYGYLRDFFGTQNLAPANGLVQAISIVAILAGTLVFSILFEMWFPAELLGQVDAKGNILQALVAIGGILVINSLVELWMVYRLPNVDAVTSDEKADSTPKTAKATAIKGSEKGSDSWQKTLASVWRSPGTRLCMIGLAMFWAVGQVLLATFPAFAKETLGELNTIVIQGIVAATGVGIALGSVIAGRLSKNYIELGLIPLGAVGIAGGLFLLPSLTSSSALALNFLMIGVMGGLFIVPLNALIQFNAPEAELGKTLAVSNLVQNIAMFSFLVMTVVFSLLGIGSQQLLQLVAVVALIGGAYTVYKQPQSLVRFVLTFLLSRHYRVRVQGMPNIPEKEGVLLLGNHLSFVDWAVIQIACPRPVHFVMHQSIYELWYLKWFLKLFGCIPISAGSSSQQSLEQVAELLNQGKVVCLFPEGLLSRTGHLAEFRKGYERAATLANDTVSIVPFYLQGLWGSQFSRSSQRIKTTRSEGWGREVIVAFGKPLPRTLPADQLKREIFDLSITSWQQQVEAFTSIPATWIHRVKRQRSDFAIADALPAAGAQPLSATKLLSAVSAFAKRLQHVSDRQNLGLLVPTSAGGVIANMASLFAGKTLVNLNYTASMEALQASVEQAQIDTIVTSRRFLDKLANRGMPMDGLLESVQVIYLEDIKQQIGKAELLSRWAMAKVLPASVLEKLWIKPVPVDSTAAILFSSGSEGLPKGVELSHRNILANVRQIADVLNTRDRDSVMASLPLFHAFGLTVTQFMPLIEGLPVVCHPDPTDAPTIAKAVARYQLTVMCGTATFLRLYCRNNKVHPLMFDSLRIVVSGAEKLPKDVRQGFKQKFNKEIYEGYGATETSPVASVNLPDVIDYSTLRVQQGGKPGTVGMPLPGTSFKIVDPDTFDELPTGEAGMILIGGVQVMTGYLNNPEKTQQVIKYIDGVRWYVSGDKGLLDKDGYLTIVDRYSRFAKLGGEMVSLSAVEQAVKKVLTLDQLDSDHELLAVNLPDKKKGERIVLMTTLPCSLDDIRQSMIDNQCNTLMIPSDLVVVDEIPKLGSGKTDLSRAKQYCHDYFITDNDAKEEGK